MTEPEEPRVEGGFAYGAPRYAESRKARIHLFDPGSVVKIGTRWTSASAYCGVELQTRKSYLESSISCPKCKSERKKHGTLAG